MRGLYAITPEFSDSETLYAKVEQALLGGTKLLQYRNKHGDAALKYQQACGLHALCKRYSAGLIINDDLELARQIDADGVHLGRDDGPLKAARECLGTDKIVGVSCYNQLSLADEASVLGADYLAFGSFFPSPTKPAAVRAELDLLIQAKSRYTIPIVAIGGITIHNASALLNAGADAIALSSALFGAGDVKAAARTLVTLIERSKQAL